MKEYPNSLLNGGLGLRVKGHIAFETIFFRTTLETKGYNEFPIMHCNHLRNGTMDYEGGAKIYIFLALIRENTIVVLYIFNL